MKFTAIIAGAIALATANAQTCSQLTPEVANLHNELGQPSYFCNWYLSRKRTRSPLPDYSPKQLTDACACLLQNPNSKRADEPAIKFKYPMPRRKTCNSVLESKIEMAFPHTEDFCNFYNKAFHGRSPIKGLKARQVYNGCQCLMIKMHSSSVGPTTGSPSTTTGNGNPTTTPSNPTTTPANPTTTPGGGSTTPGGGSTTPGGGSTTTSSLSTPVTTTTSATSSSTATPQTLLCNAQNGQVYDDPSGKDYLIQCATEYALVGSVTDFITKQTAVSDVACAASCSALTLNLCVAWSFEGATGACYIFPTVTGYIGTAGGNAGWDSGINTSELTLLGLSLPNPLNGGTGGTGAGGAGSGAGAVTSALNQATSVLGGAIGQATSALGGLGI